MQILSIKLKNIKSHRATELSFSPGINVLSGPNGIGKSTIFEAIGYALFGVDAQSFVGNVERFVSIGAKKGEIAVVFELAEGERYSVSRTVGTPSKWLLAKEMGGNFEVEEHKDSKETEARLKDLLGLDNGRPLAEQFELVIGPFQHEFLGPFVIKQPKTRRNKFDEILGIDSWRKTDKETLALEKAIKAKVEVLKSAIGPLQNQLEALPEKLAQLKGAQQENSATQKNLQNREQSYQQVVDQLSEIDKREQVIKDISAEITTLKGRIENGKEMIAGQQSSVEAAQKAQLIVAENEAAKQAYERAEQQLTALAGKVKQQRQLEREVAEFEKQLGNLTGQINAETQAFEKAEADLLKEELDLSVAREKLVVDEDLPLAAARLPGIRSSIDTVRKQLGRLEGRRSGLEEGSEKLAEGICPFFQEPCLNIAEAPPQDVFSGKFAELEQERLRLIGKIEELAKDETVASQANEQLQKMTVQIKGLDEQGMKLENRRKAVEKGTEGLAKLQEQMQKKQRQLAAKQAELDVYKDLQTELDIAEKEKLTHQPGRELFIANQQQASELEKRRTDLEKFEALLEQLNGDLARKQTELSTANQAYDAEQHQLLRGQKDAIGQELGALGQKLKNLDKEIVRLNSEIDRLKQIEVEIKAKLERIKDYGEKEKLVKFLRNKVFRNVSAHLSERFREEISQRADRIYRTIAEVDEELCWGDNYQIVLRDMVDGEIRERIDDQLSGGQIMSAVVSLRLALLQTIGARVAFFDEPTSNLDAVRRENLAHAFRAIDVGREEVTEHWYDQLFLISHDVAFTEVTDQIVALDN